MATPTKSPAKKARAKKSAAKKTAAKKTNVQETPASANSATDRIGHVAEVVAKFATDAAHTYVGVGLVVQDGIRNYSTFVDDARQRGEEFATDIQSKLEPYADRIKERFEPVVDRMDFPLPHQVQDVVDAAVDRTRELLPL